jgi:hypothetical protein
MGFFFHSIVKPELRMRTELFRFALVYPVLYFPIFLSLVVPDGAIPVWVQLSLYLVCIACFVYLFHFVAKNLVMVKIKKHAPPNKYWPRFLLLFFFPRLVDYSTRGKLGFMQRINRAEARSRQLAMPVLPQASLLLLTVCLVAYFTVLHGSPTNLPGKGAGYWRPRS